MAINEFTELVKKIRVKSPGLTYKEAQARAKLMLKKAVSPITTPTLTEVVIPIPEEIGIPDFDIVEIEKAARSGAGIMHLKCIVCNQLKGRDAVLVMDKKEGVHTTCHIEVQGFRIPADPNEFFRY